MTSRRPKRGNVDRLKETICGFCGALGPPTVYMPANTGDRFPTATALHEKCHALLLASTTYGYAEQILVYLSKSGCTHIPKEFLKQAIDQCVENSFYVHEGCATLTERSHIEKQRPADLHDFMRTVDEDYEYGMLLLSAATDIFGFEGYLAGWMALQVATVCLSPPLFGPLSFHENYRNGKIAEIFIEETFSANLRLDRLISDGKAGRLRTLAENIRTAVHASTHEVFSSSVPDWQNAPLRQDFIRRCEPIVDDHFAAAYPGFYLQFRQHHEQWESIWNSLVADFHRHGCDCLAKFSFEKVNLLRGSKSTRPVATPLREGHPGAMELESWDALPRGSGKVYYTALGFCEQAQPVVICNTPRRLLKEGHLYTRLHQYAFQDDQVHFAPRYWFIFSAPPLIPSALKSIATLQGVRVCSIAGGPHRILARMADCCEHSLDGLYLQIDGVTAEGFEGFVQATQPYQFEMFFLGDEQDQNGVLFLKNKNPGYHAIMPVTEETSSEILRRVENIQRVNSEPGRPTLHDDICYRHLCQYGW